MSLEAALQALPAGGTLALMDGVYTVTTSSVAPLFLGVVGGTSTVMAYAEARPIITDTSGDTPRVHMRANTRVEGLWFGGAKPETDMPVTLNGGTTIVGCTFFNYFGGIGEGGNTGNTYTRNRFINCGTGTLYHDFYISNGHGAGNCALTENIHIGGGGYKTHLYNGVNGVFPSNVRVIGNFYGDVQWGQAVYGSGHTVEENILWSTVGDGGTNITATLQETSTFSWSRNVIGQSTARIFYHDSEGQSADGNAIVNGAASQGAGDPLGTNLSVWQEADILANLGASSSTIDTAITALDTAFGQTVSEIQADATIETHFATLKSVIDTWRAANE